MTHDSSHSRRWLWLSIALLVLPALALLLVHSWLGWEGERLWQQAQARLKAEGETLDFMALVPKPVPDEDNFFAVEQLKDIALVIDGDEKKGEPGARRKRFEELSFAAGSNEAEYPTFTSGVDYGTKWDAKAWADYYRESQKLPMPMDSKDPGHDILAGLEKGDALCAELHTGLSRRYACFTPLLAQQILTNGAFMDSRRHTSVCSKLHAYLKLRTQAAADVGATEQAVADLGVLLRFAEGLGHETSLINGLLAIAFAGSVTDPCWTLLEKQGLRSGGFLKIEEAVSRVSIHEIMGSSILGELARVGRSKDGIIQMGNKLTPDDLHDPSSTGFTKVIVPYAKIALWNLNPQSVAQGNTARAIEIALEYQVCPFRKGGLNGLIASAEKFIRDHPSGKLDDNDVMSMVVDNAIEATGGIARRALIVEARLHQARLACALERFFLQHQRYPDTLNELVPAFIDKVLLDPCDDKPMRYARTDAGRYKLWSLGFDGEDDGGKVIASPKDDPSQPKLSARDYPGDWVWSYERLVPLAAP